MSNFTYTVDDPHDRIVDIVTAPGGRSMVDVVASHSFSKNLRDYHWENRRITSRGTYYGEREYQWVAKIPGRIAELLDMRHPGWDTDEASMRKILKLYPECSVNPTGGVV